MKIIQLLIVILYLGFLLFLINTVVNSSRNFIKLTQTYLKKYKSLCMDLFFAQPKK